MTTLATGAALRGKAQQQPARSNQELFEVVMERLEFFFELEEIRAGRTVAVDGKKKAFRGRIAVNFELFVAAGKGPHLLSHAEEFRIQRLARLAVRENFLKRARPGTARRG